MSTVQVERHEGDRHALRRLFELAEDSRSELDSYIDAGELLVAVTDEEVVGHLQLIENELPDHLEIKNMAVLERSRRLGVGRALIDAALQLARERSCSAVDVSTATADVGNLRFYQRCGFRMRSIERDAFTPASGYDGDADVDGIPLRDRVCLDLRLDDHVAPDHQMQVRVARHTMRLPELVRFYRHGLGLTEIDGFRDHDGYDGVVLALPGTRAHLEFTTGGNHGAPAPHPETLLVLYLGEREIVDGALARVGVEPIAPANPYWAHNGVTIEDPDGFRVVLVPEPYS